MDSTPRSSMPGTQRTLAAIVFTDVVGFSARMQKAEVRTLELLQQDFAAMRRLCAEHEGSVLKTTGDGLLMRFTSAVQAVACALAMQNYFAAETKAAAEGDRLQHRVGIHLGDVLVQDQDVMGDGVNIASRIQGEAEPGGICISQTVLDVVKNKLELKVVSLGARELKNITEAMPVYRLLLEAQELGSKTPFPINAPTAAPAAKPAARPNRKLLWTAGIVAGIALAFAAGTLVRKSTAPVPVERPTANAATSPRNKAANPGGGGRRNALDAMAQLREQYRERLDHYDFEGLARDLRDQRDDTNRPAVALLARSAEQMRATKDWMMVALRRHPRARPLSVPNLADSTAAKANVFLSADGRLHFLDNTGPANALLDELKPPVVGNILASLLADASAPAPREVVMGAQAFARVYELPVLQEHLATARTKREKETTEKQ